MATAGRRKTASMLPHLVRSLGRPTPAAHSPNQALPSLRRAFSLYDQINLMDNVPEDQLRFQGYSDTGFTVNGVKYEGSLLIVENLLTSWSPKRFSEITADSLSMFKLVRPIPAVPSAVYLALLLLSAAGFNKWHPPLGKAQRHPGFDPGWKCSMSIPPQAGDFNK
ncbi:hypothetical protein Taro_004382, partial [Colocasia esculenta]|nr:hypothetical protein [Colocasia esculenta]